MTSPGGSADAGSDPSTGATVAPSEGHTVDTGRGGVHESGALMSSTIQYLPTSQAAPPMGDAVDRRRRGQGWIMVFGASAVLWAGIIAAIVGIVNLLQ